MDEELRRLAREAEAAGTARAWSSYAAALARAGLPLEAYAAAVRATALDGGASRDLLVPPIAPGQFVPWRGLRALGPPRVVPYTGPPRHVHGTLLDLGRGAALVSKREYDPRSLAWTTDPVGVAIDVISGEILWRRPAPPAELVLGDRIVWLARDGTLRTASTRTGAASPPIRVPGIDVRHTSLFRFDARTVGALLIDERRWAMLLTDLEGRGPVTIPLGSRGQVSVLTSHELVIALHDSRIEAFDRSGTRRWSAEVRGDFLGDPHGRLVFDARDEGCVIFIDAATGSRVGAIERPCQVKLVIPAGETLLAAGTDDFVAIDATTLEERWRRDFPAPLPLVLTTADAIIVVEPAFSRGADPTKGRVKQVFTLDAETGEELSRRSMAGSGAYGTPALVAGRLVFHTRKKDAILTILDPVT